MDKKIVVVGVVAILLAVTLIGVMQVTDKDDGGNDSPKLEGNWILTYVERVYLVNDVGEPIFNVEDCVITEHYLNTLTNVHKMNIECTGKDFFKGSFDGKEEFFGSYNGVSFMSQDVVAGTEPHMYHMQGAIKGDHLSLTSIRYDFSDPEKISSVSYLMFIREGTNLVSPMVDFINYDVRYQHVHSIRHCLSDFTVNKDGKGEIFDSELRHYSTHGMLSLFEIVNDGSKKGIMVLSSLGKSRSGAAMAVTAGNINVDGNASDAFIGSASMAHGKMYVSNFFTSGNEPGFVEYQYNVSYDQGNTFPVLSLYSKYQGSIDIWDQKGKHQTVSITKTFEKYNTAFFAVDVEMGKEYYWFGEFSGPILNLFISTPDGFGRFVGHIDKGGEIVVTGTVLLKSGKVTAYAFELHPVKG